MSIKRILSASAALALMGLGGCVAYDPYAPYPVAQPYVYQPAPQAYYPPPAAYYPAPAYYPAYPAVGSVSLSFGTGWGGHRHHHHGRRWR